MLTPALDPYDDAWAYDEDEMRPLIQVAVAMLDLRHWRDQIATTDDYYLAADLALSRAVDLYGFLRGAGTPAGAASHWADACHDWLCRGWGHKPGRKRLPRYSGIPYGDCGVGISEEACGPPLTC